MCLTPTAINGTTPNQPLPLPRIVTTILHYIGFSFSNREEVDMAIPVFNDNEWRRSLTIVYSFFPHVCTGRGQDPFPTLHLPEGIRLEHTLLHWTHCGLYRVLGKHAHT